jgi:hypothetical protein
VHTEKNQHQAYLFGAGAVLLWSTVATAFKLSLRHLSPVFLLLSSSLVSTVVLGGILAVQQNLFLLRRLTRRQLLRAAGLGALNPFLYYLVLFEAYDRLDAQLAQPLNYTWAITLSFLAVPLLGQKLLTTDVIGAVVSYAGVVLLCARSSFREFRFADPVGVGLALGSTLLWALYWIANTRDRKDPVLGLFLNFVCGTVYVFVAALVLEPSLGAALSGWGLLGAAYVGVFEMGVAFYLWLKAMKLAESTARVSNLIFFSPFLSLVFIYFLLGEQIYLSTFFGLSLIVAGTLTQRQGARRARCARQKNSVRPGGPAHRVDRQDSGHSGH